MRSCAPTEPHAWPADYWIVLKSHLPRRTEAKSSKNAKWFGPVLSSPAIWSVIFLVLLFRPTAMRVYGYMANIGCIQFPRVLSPSERRSFTIHGHTAWNSLLSAVRDSIASYLCTSAETTNATPRLRSKFGERAQRQARFKHVLRNF